MSVSEAIKACEYDWTYLRERIGSWQSPPKYALWQDEISQAGDPKKLTWTGETIQPVHLDQCALLILFICKTTRL